VAKRKSAPNFEDVLDIAHGLVDDNKKRDTLYDAMDALYDQAKAKEQTDEGVKHMTMPYATNAIDLVADLASQAKMSLTVPAAKETVEAKKEADQQEEWLLACRKGNEKRGDETLNADLAWLTAQRGLNCIRTIFTDSLLEKGSNGYDVVGVPVLMQVRDPRIVYPQWNATGIECVVEASRRRVSDIRRFHPNALEDKEKYRPEMEVEWIEYWDEKYRMYLADGEPVSVRGKSAVPHGYGVVPYAFGRARGTPRQAPEFRYRPLLRGVENTINNLDTWFSVLTTAGWSAVTNAWALYSEEKKALDLTSGAKNYLAPGDRIETLQRATLPEDFFQLGAMLMQALQQGTFPFALFGDSPGDLAGYAINLLSQAGRRPLAPIWAAIQSCYERAFYNVVQIAKNKVAPLTGDKVPLVVVMASEKAELSQKMVRRNLELNTAKIDKGFEVTVLLSDPMPADKAGNLRMAIEAYTAKILSLETSLQEFGIVTNPMAEMDRMTAEDIYRRLAPYTGLKLAINRGYIPDKFVLPEGWILDSDGQLMPEALVPQPSPAAMQGLDGQPQMEALNALAGGMPVQEQPQPMPTELPPVMGGGVTPI